MLEQSPAMGDKYSSIAQPRKVDSTQLIVAILSRIIDFKYKMMNKMMKGTGVLDQCVLDMDDICKYIRVVCLYTISLQLSASAEVDSQWEREG